MLFRSNSANGPGNKPLIGDQSKWDIRAGVWKNLLPLKVALIGRPLVSFRTSYAQGVSPKDWASVEDYRDLMDGAKTLYSTWDPTLDAAKYEYDDKSLKDYRDRFQKCLDAKSCSREPEGKVTAPDSTLDKGAFLARRRRSAMTISACPQGALLQQLPLASAAPLGRSPSFRTAMCPFRLSTSSRASTSGDGRWSIGRGTFPRIPARTMTAPACSPRPRSPSIGYR